jgi:adenosylcobyric acid synthase
MKLASTLMVQGTASTVGKSLVVAGLCRIFARDGWRVAPFKAQNMALNSFVTRAGGEIGRAQAMQAEAAGIEPTVEMNPILLKPEGEMRSQVIVLGRPLASSEARAYYQQRNTLFPIVQQALQRLREAYDLVIIEGAGSPVELNLAHMDLVNMAVARLADAPVLLVGDIDRGGIFASLLGTLDLLAPEDRARVKGLIVNKFRGDYSLWQAGERLLAEKGGVPVLGTLPFVPDLRLAEEDSVALDENTASILQHSHQAHPEHLDIVVIRLPYLSNYDEFDALAAEPMVQLHVVGSPEAFPQHPDLIILPGTKQTVHDLAWLWHRGLAQGIRSRVRHGSAVLGICGGYQMLGERVCDMVGAETAPGTVEPGLQLLPVETHFEPLAEKMTAQSICQIAPAAQRGLFAQMQGLQFSGYQIHAGRTRASTAAAGTPAFQMEDGEKTSDGWLSADGWRVGCYVHGLFENEPFRHRLLGALLQRRSPNGTLSRPGQFNRQADYDRWAGIVCQHLDLAQLYACCHLHKQEEKTARWHP